MHIRVSYSQRRVYWTIKSQSFKEKFFLSIVLSRFYIWWWRLPGSFVSSRLNALSNSMSNCFIFCISASSSCTCSGFLNACRKSKAFKISCNSNPKYNPNVCWSHVLHFCTTTIEFYFEIYCWSRNYYSFQSGLKTCVFYKYFLSLFDLNQIDLSKHCTRLESRNAHEIHHHPRSS